MQWWRWRWCWWWGWWWWLWWWLWWWCGGGGAATASGAAAAALLVLLLLPKYTLTCAPARARTCMHSHTQAHTMPILTPQHARRTLVLIAQRPQNVHTHARTTHPRTHAHTHTHTHTEGAGRCWVGFPHGPGMGRIPAVCVLARRVGGTRAGHAARGQVSLPDAAAADPCRAVPPLDRHCFAIRWAVLVRVVALVLLAVLVALVVRAVLVVVAAAGACVTHTQTRHADTHCTARIRSIALKLYYTRTRHTHVTQFNCIHATDSPHTHHMHKNAHNQLLYTDAPTHLHIHTTHMRLFKSHTTHRHTSCLHTNDTYTPHTHHTHAIAHALHRTRTRHMHTTARTARTAHTHARVCALTRQQRVA